MALSTESMNALASLLLPTLFSANLTFNTLPSLFWVINTLTNQPSSAPGKFQTDLTSAAIFLIQADCNLAF